MVKLFAKNLWLASLSIGLMTGAASAVTRGNPAGDRSEQSYVVESTRATVANQFHLMAADLLDELVYRWAEHPPTATETQVVLLGLNVPNGFNGTFSGFLEDHFFNLLLSHPETKLVPIHCAVCTAPTIVSTQKGTYMGPGLDIVGNDFWLGRLARDQKEYQGVFLDFSVEGHELKLRARRTEIGANPKILSATTLATSSSEPPLLRATKPLISADEARREYLDILSNRSPVEIPLRLSLDFFSANNGSTVVLPPMLWVQGGAETWITHRRQWLGGAFLGVSSIPKTYDAWTVGTRIARLIAPYHSLTRPNFYAFLETSYFEMTGPASVLFRNQELMYPNEVLDEIRNSKSPLKATDGRIKFGFELKLRDYYRGEAFLEVLPNQTENENLGKIAGFAHAWGIGMGVTL